MVMLMVTSEWSFHVQGQDIQLCLCFFPVNDANVQVQISMGAVKQSIENQTKTQNSFPVT